MIIPTTKHLPRYIALSILLCALPLLRLQAQQDRLSNVAEISLITAEPGTEVYSYFGHSAIHIRDTLQGIDRVYNYGTFDFDTPNFYGKFVRGQLPYRLAVGRFDGFLENYSEENRSLYAQILNLSTAEKQRLYDLLIENYRPENREYPYDFFFDNCATRIRDIIAKAVPNNALHFDENPGNPPLTFRQLIDPYIRRNKWLDWGIDLILGVRSDRIATPYEYQFLPDHLQTAFDKASIVDSAGIRRPLVANKLILFKATPDYTPPSWVGRMLTPLVLFPVLCVLGIALSWWAQRRGHALSGLDYTLLSILGLLGWLLVFCWVGTQHKVLAGNYNLLWAMPLHLPLLFLLPRFSKTWQRGYWLFTCFLALAACVVTLLQQPQGLHQAVFPIAVLVMFRCMVRLRALGDTK
ncbi:MAG: DUF4105 domain-containing protein [Chitinophagales bacterium]|nr:DUF4105 domain-containing protein [Chitinophagales bacterium]